MRANYKILTATAVLGLGLLATAAYAQQTGHGKMFERLDADHNGVVTRDEARAGEDRFFGRFDTSGDGVISREEFQAAADRRFAKFDLNGNGEVSSEEAAQAKLNWRTKQSN